MIAAARAPTPRDGLVRGPVAGGVDAGAGPALDGIPRSGAEAVADRPRRAGGFPLLVTIPDQAELVDPARGILRRAPHLERQGRRGDREGGARHHHRAGRRGQGDRRELVGQLRRVTQRVGPADIDAVGEVAEAPVVRESLVQDEVDLERLADRLAGDLRRRRRFRRGLAAAERPAGDEPRVAGRRRLLPGAAGDLPELENGALVHGRALQQVPVRISERRQRFPGLHRHPGRPLDEQRPDPRPVRRGPQHPRIHSRHCLLRVGSVVRTRRLPHAVPVGPLLRRPHPHHEGPRRRVALPGHCLAPLAHDRRLRGPGHGPHPEGHLRLRFRSDPNHRLRDDLRRGRVEPLLGRRHPQLVAQRLRHRFPTPLDEVRPAPRHLGTRRPEDERRRRRVRPGPGGEWSGPGAGDALDPGRSVAGRVQFAVQVR